VFRLGEAIPPTAVVCFKVTARGVFRVFLGSRTDIELIEKSPFFLHSVKTFFLPFNRLYDGSFLTYDAIAPLRGNFPPP